MRQRTGIGLVACAALGLALAASAEDVEAPEVSHDPAQLETLLDESVAAPRTNTALVFTSLVDEERRIVCRARNARGESIGHAAVRVPAHGIGHLLASDLSAGAPFAGQVRCVARRGVRGSGFLRSTNGLSAVPTAPLRRGGIHFPVVVTR